MAKLLRADYLYTPQGFIQNGGVVFEEAIIDVGNGELLESRYPQAKTIQTPPHTVLYPGFINLHVHLEYSANKTTLRYGHFMEWLDSVISHRDGLMQVCDNAMMRREIEAMLQSGITTFGAISNFGSELEVCQSSPQRVVFFNELVGSQPSMVDALYSDFLERLEASMQSPPDARIIPAVAIHAPYSVHPIVLQKAINLARTKKLPLSTHFLESPDELLWLTEAKGGFKDFFQKFFNTSDPVNDLWGFVRAFDHYGSLFVHGVQADQAVLEHLAKQGHTIVHCPRSNRYLGVGRLKIETLDALNLPFAVATDGLSSNDSLSLLDELRSALMLHDTIEIKALANRLIEAITHKAGEALRLNIGKLQAGYKADFALITLPDLPQSTQEVALWSILHAKRVDALYIDGERYV